MALSGWDLTFDTQYGYFFNLACERFYKRIDLGCNFVQLFGGSAAAIAVTNGRPNWIVGAGLALAAVAAISLLIQPAVKAEQHLQAKCRYLALSAQATKISYDEWSLELNEVRHSSPAGVKSLAVPAYNDTLDATGCSTGHRTLTWPQRIAAALG